MGFQGTTLIPGRSAIGTGISQTVKNSNWIHVAAQEPSPLQLTSGDDSLTSLMAGIIWEIDRNTNFTEQPQYPRANSRHIEQGHAFDLMWTANFNTHLKFPIAKNPTSEQALHLVLILFLSQPSLTHTMPETSHPHSIHGEMSKRAKVICAVSIIINALKQIAFPQKYTHHFLVRLHLAHKHDKDHTVHPNNNFQSVVCIEFRTIFVSSITDLSKTLQVSKGIVPKSLLICLSFLYQRATIGLAFTIPKLWWYC